MMFLFGEQFCPSYEDRKNAEISASLTEQSNLHSVRLRQWTRGRGTYCDSSTIKLAHFLLEKPPALMRKATYSQHLQPVI